MRHPIFLFVFYCVFVFFFVCLLYLLFSIVDRVLIVFIVFVIVLSLVLGAVAVFYGTGGAVVVAGKARQALAVVFPFWAFALAPFYVVGGADAGTLAAMYAALRVYTKLAVAYNPFDESVSD